MMNKKEVIDQLESLIDDAETHRIDGHLDDIFEDDIEALRYAISCIKSAPPPLPEGDKKIGFRSGEGAFSPGERGNASLNEE